MSSLACGVRGQPCFGIGRNPLGCFAWLHKPLGVFTSVWLFAGTMKGKECIRQNSFVSSQLMWFYLFVLMWLADVARMLPSCDGVHRQPHAHARRKEKGNLVVKVPLVSNNSHRSVTPRCSGCSWVLDEASGCVAIIIFILQVLSRVCAQGGARWALFLR